MANVIEVLLRTRSDTRGISTFQRSLAGLKSALPALGVVGAAGGFLALAKGAADASDEVTRLQSKLRLVTSGTAELAKVQDQIVNLARQTRTDFTAVGELYARIARFGRELNVSQSDILTTTKAVSQALQISGATAEQASNGVIQFTQALAGGVVRAEEFNSIIETMPRLAEAMADGLGITIGQLRKMVVEGKLASNVALGALLSQSKKLNEEFRKLEPTIGSSFSQLGSELKLFGAELLQTTGIAKGLTSAVNGLASGVRGLTNQTKDVKSFFAAIKEAIPIGKLALDNPFAGAISAQFALRKGAIAGLQEEQKSLTPKPIVPVDIEEFRVTLRKLVDYNADALRELEEETRTSTERASASYSRLKAALQTLLDEGRITREQFDARIEAGQRDILGLEEIDLNEIRAKYKVLKKETSELGEFMKGVWREVGRSIQSTLSDAIYEWRLSWRSLLDIARRALADITAAIITSGIKEALKNATSGGSGSGSSGANYLKAIAGFFGFAAGGGRVDRPTIVGESGAELVLPPGRVMNQRQMAFAGAGNINYSPSFSVAIVEREDAERTRAEVYQNVAVMLAQDKAEFVRTLQRSGYEVRG